MLKISVEVEPSLELLKDIAITAVEGGIGYWANCQEYKWRETTVQAIARMTAELGAPPEPDDIERKDLPFPVLVIEPRNELSEFSVTTVTPELVAKGLQVALTRGAGTCVGIVLRGSVLEAVVLNDASNLDADDCDNIIQLGMFENIVYA